MKTAVKVYKTMSLKVVKMPEFMDANAGIVKRRRVLPGKLPIVPRFGQGARQEF
jgi:hypothetical protein